MATRHRARGRFGYALGGRLRDPGDHHDDDRFPDQPGKNEVGLVEGRVDGKPGPAAEAGLKPGDVIVENDGQPTENWNDTRGAIRETQPGDTMQLVVERDGERMELDARLGTAV